MKFKLLLKQLRGLKLPVDQFAVTSSGPMAVRGIREARDLDIVVTDKLWEELSKKYPVIPRDLCDTLHVGDVEILGNFSKNPNSGIATVDEQINTADVIDGIRFVNLNLIIKFKQELGREKDLKDIKLIKEYLDTHNVILEC